MSKTFRSSVLAGICIGIGGFVNLAVGPWLGPILFAFGLSTVICYKFRLYTGTAGFIQNGNDFKEMWLILLGNIVGCLLVALLARLSPLPIVEGAGKILHGRLGVGPFAAGALAIACGFIMTAAVRFAREGKWLPLVFGVPLFIFCGFPHSIADAFYYLAAPWDMLGWDVLLLYVMIVLGNFVGCNLTRFILWDRTA